jgi:hypothetical protein
LACEVVKAGPVAVVAATDNPWLAGMPDGSTAAFFDVAPFNSAEQVLLAFSAAQFLTFAVPGSAVLALRGLAGAVIVRCRRRRA